MVSGPEVKFSQHISLTVKFFVSLTSSALELASLVELASGRVDVATLALGDANVVAGTGTTNSYVGTRELVADALVNTRLAGCEDNVSMLSYVVEGIEGCMNLTSNYKLQTWFLKDLLLSLEV